MKNKSRRRVWSALFYFAVLFLTFYYVFNDRNLSQIVHLLSEARLSDIAVAVCAVVAFILGESVVLHYLLRRLGTKAKFWHCSLFSFVGFFYSAITPSASGGQPMQVVFMRRDGIPAAVSTVVLAIVTITYKLVLVVIGLAVMIFRPAVVMTCLADVEPLIYLGMGLNVAAISLLLMAVFLPGPLEKCVSWAVHLVHRIHPFRNLEQVMARVDSSLSQYRGTAAYFKKEPGIILVVFLITLVQRFCLFSVVWFTYRAFGLSGQSAVTVTLLYGMISVAVDMLPLPGGMGISESMFSSIFLPVFGPELVVPGMILCRGISYYTQLLISGVMTVVTQFVFRTKKTQKTP